MKIGMHAVYERSFAEAIHKASECGFDYVQFDLNVPQFYVDQISGRQLVKAAQHIDTKGGNAWKLRIFNWL